MRPHDRQVRSRHRSRAPERQRRRVRGAARSNQPRLAWVLRDLPVELVGRMRSVRVMRLPKPPRRPGTNGRPPKHGPEFRFAKPETWPDPAVTGTTNYGKAEAQAWDRVHPRLTHRSSWLDHDGEPPIVEGTSIRLKVEHPSKDRDAPPGPARAHREPGSPTRRTPGSALIGPGRAPRATASGPFGHGRQREGGTFRVGEGAYGGSGGPAQRLGVTVRRRRRSRGRGRPRGAGRSGDRRARAVGPASPRKTVCLRCHLRTSCSCRERGRGSGGPAGVDRRVRATPVRTTAIPRAIRRLKSSWRTTAPRATETTGSR